LKELFKKIRREGSSVSLLEMEVRFLRLQVTDAIQIMDGVCHLFSTIGPECEATPLKKKKIRSLC